MPKRIYARIDFQLIIRLTRKGGATVQFSDSEDSQLLHIPKRTVNRWLQTKPSDPVLIGAEFNPINEMMENWQRTPVGQFVVDTAHDTPPDEYIRRLTLNLIDPELQQLNWEWGLLLRYKLTNVVIVRLGTVRPHISTTSLAFPVRVLLVNPVFPAFLKQSVAMRLGRSLSQRKKNTIIQVHPYRFNKLAQVAAPFGKPTFEVLHFAQLPTLNSPDILSTASPQQPGTLGWFMRVMDLWQTRLLFIQCENGQQVATTRLLAQAIVDRGGPAVLIINVSDLIDGFTHFDFYDKIIHDFPFDAALHDFSAFLPFPTNISLFAGMGREEALRFSSIGDNLTSLKRVLIAQRDQGAIKKVSKKEPHPMEVQIETEVADTIKKIINWTKTTPKSDISYNQRLIDIGISSDVELAQFSLDIVYSLDLVYSLPLKNRPSYNKLFQTLRPENTVKDVINIILKDIRSETSPSVSQPRALPLKKLDALIANVEKFEDAQQAFKFNIKEHEGLIPLAKAIGKLRKTITTVNAIFRLKETNETEQLRYVNTSFWTTQPNDIFRLVDQQREGLIINQSYQLAVQVGAKDARIQTLGTTPILEEVFKWDDIMDGVWVEIGVTGLDFAVSGSPVQELWVPRRSTSEPIYFTVTPQKMGVSRLRFCLYYRQNLIQSFRVAIVTQHTSEIVNYTTALKKKLATALDINLDQVGQARYLPRLEYSLVHSFEETATRPPRALSIFANDLHGESILTIKGPDYFEVRRPGDISTLVSNVRDILTEVSFVKNGSTDPEDWFYAYNTTALQPTTLKEALCKLAEQGKTLFARLIAGSSETLKGPLALLNQNEQLISVGHLLVEKVIPWAVIYDRPYDPNRSNAGHDVCLAGLPTSNGIMPIRSCGTHPDCLLHESQVAQRSANGELPLCEKAVVCPLHFWGFKHNIDLPPHSTQDISVKPTPQKDCILSDGTTRIIVGANSQLTRWATHQQALNILSQKTDYKISMQVSTLRDDLLNALEDPNFDIIYFFCHAGKQRDNTPFLQFFDPVKNEPSFIYADDLGRELWKHSPLVFLNGCGTVGFRPDALSPFIDTMVTDRGASGIIGTEVTVHEDLATEVVAMFLKYFLSGQPAGEALLRTRRALLAQNNPLGLAYTLYGAAHLQLDTDGDGICKTATPRHHELFNQ